MKLHRLLFSKLYNRLEEAKDKCQQARIENKALSDSIGQAREMKRLGMIKAWCFNETHSWHGRKLDYEQTLTEYHRYNNTRASCFLLSIKDSQVTVVDKPAFPINVNCPQMEAFYYRINIVYRPFFQEVVDTLPNIPDLLLLIEVGDEPLNSDTVPTFSFQKRLGDSTILMPDPDFICYEFYHEEKYKDAVPYTQKLNKAVFVGSTSSLGNSVESVRARENPRIDAGLFFRNDSRVDFRLPNLVQCVDEEAPDVLKAMGFGQGNPVSWQDQFQYKFLISMDGNGATCSRVIISLKSNSVLLKYNSNSVLFYFSTLIPWLHYIPISNHKEVCDLVDFKQKNPGHCKVMSDMGQYFVRDYLSKEMVIRYTGAILTQYMEMFTSLPLESTEPISLIPVGGLAYSGTQEEVFSGREVIGLRGSKKQLTGFALFPEPMIPWKEMEYQAISDGDSNKSPWCFGGQLCGSKETGRSSLRGFRIRQNGPASSAYSIQVTAQFIDGSIAEFQGNTLEVIGTDFLESFTLNLLPRNQTPAHGVETPWKSNSPSLQQAWSQEQA